MGKWNGDDVKELGAPFLALVLRVGMAVISYVLSGLASYYSITAALQSFARLAGDLHTARTSTPPEGNSTASSSSETVSGSPNTNDEYLLKQIHQHNLVAETSHSVCMDDLIPIIRQSTIELRQACIGGLGAIQASINLVNGRRWSRRADLDEQNIRELDEAIQVLSSALFAFKDTKRKLLVEPYVPLIRGAKNRREQEALPLRPLYIAFVFASNLTVVSNSTLRVMELVRDKIHKRTKNRLWIPKGLRMLGKLLLTRERKEHSSFGEDLLSNPSDDERDQHYRERTTYLFIPWPWFIDSTLCEPQDEIPTASHPQTCSKS